MTFLAPLSDVVVVAACIGAALGCFVLNQRVRRLASTERGIGKAVSEMARSVGQFETLLAAAEASTREASTILDEQLDQARKLVTRLEMLAGGAPRPAAPQPPRKATAPAEPLAEVVPKGAAVAAPTTPPAAGIGTSNDTAQMRLADLAQRRARIADTAAGLGRGPRA